MKYLLLILILIAAASLVAQDRQFSAADQSVFALPTAYTMPAGTHAVTDYELVLLQYAYAPVDRLHLSAGMVFPFTTDMLRTFSLGFKYNYYKSDTFYSSIWTSYSPDPNMMTVGNVISYGSPKTNVHLGVGTGVQFGHEIDNFVIGAGLISGFSRRVSGMLEFESIIYNFYDNEDTSDNSVESEQIVTVGVRLKGEDLSWDFGVVRPLNADMGDFIGIPFLKATFLF